MRKQDEFLAQSEQMAFNREHRERMLLNSYAFEGKFEKGAKQFANLDLARSRAAYAKWKVVENLDKHLIEFESNVIKKGGKVLWAEDAAAALNEVAAILKKVNATNIVKSKSAVADEINLNDFLKKQELQLVETNIGDYLVDVAKEKPYHPIQAALNKNRFDISQLLNDTISSSLDAPAQELTQDICVEVRSQFKQATVGITGADFLVADSGLVGLSDNEGNSRLCSAMPKVHIVLAGIENVIPSLTDAELFFSLYATYTYGQKLTSYSTLVGPKMPGDKDGPQEFYVILLDNGRSSVLSHQEQRQAMTCIKCAACINVCPVYQNIGGYAYGVPMIGPIGSVIAPLQLGLDEYKHLSFSHPINGKSVKICPVKIDIDTHLIRNRKESVQQGFQKNAEKLMWYSWKKIMMSRKNMNKGTSIKGFMLKSFFKSSWGERREFPKLADKSFNQLWREKTGQK
jgi:L-lactate dehydrogenase complex protein LldF